jgi:hypothetical protein
MTTTAGAGLPELEAVIRRELTNVSVMTSLAGDRRDASVTKAMNAATDALLIAMGDHALRVAMRLVDDKVIRDAGRAAMAPERPSVTARRRADLENAVTRKKGPAR